MLSFGDKLRLERESRDKALEEIASTTQIHRGYLEALERNEFESLPGPNFGKLYIRAYAEVLGFDPGPLITDYDRERYSRRKAGEATPRARPPRIRREPPEARRSEPAATPPAEPPEARRSEPLATPPAEPERAERAEAAGIRKEEAEVLSPDTGTRPSSGSRWTIVAAVLIGAGLLTAAASVYLARSGTGDGDAVPAPPEVSDATTALPEPSASRPEPGPVSDVVVDRENVDETPAQGTSPAKPVDAVRSGAPAGTRPAAPSPRPTAGPPPDSSRLAVREFGVGRRVVDRRLEGRTDRFPEGGVVWFSTRVLGGAPGGSIRHVWLREGKTIQAIELKLGGPNWRTHSRKTLWGVGRWAVEARAPDGRVLARESFTCVPAGS